MTARCALYMRALKIFGNPWLCLRLLFPKFLMGFSSIDAMNMRTKFEVRSFTRSWDNWGTPKLGSLWICPRSLFTKIFNELLFGWTLLIFLPNLKFVASSVFEIIAIGVLGFGVEVANPQSWGRGGRRGPGWYRSKERLWLPIGSPL